MESGGAAGSQPGPCRGAQAGDRAPTCWPDPSPAAPPSQRPGAAQLIVSRCGSRSASHQLGSARRLMTPTVGSRVQRSDQSCRIDTLFITLHPPPPRHGGHSLCSVKLHQQQQQHEARSRRQHHAAGTRTPSPDSSRRSLHVSQHDDNQRKLYLM